MHTHTIPPPIHFEWNFVKKRKIVFPVILSSLLLFSCSEMESVPDSQLLFEAQAVKMGLDPMDPGLRFAAALSGGLKNESLRKFVSENIQDQFDGDLNFLYYSTKGQPIGGVGAKSLTFEEALFGSQSRFRSTESELEFDPLMQVALRGPEEQLVNFTDIEGEIPVLYVSPSQDLEANPLVPMITENGEMSEWDIRIIPDKLVLVISQNERLVKVPKNPAARIQSGDACLQSATPYFSDSTNDYYFYTDYFCDGGGIGGNPGGGSGGAIACDRDLDFKADHVNQIKFTTIDELDRAEPWLGGAPELYFIVYTGSSIPYLQQIRKNVPKVDRSKWKDCGVFSCVPEWNFTDIEIFHWDKTEFTETILFTWFEYDGGGTTTFKQQYASKDILGNPINYEISSTINQGDDHLGVSIVKYCDKASYTDFKIHSSSSILFGLRLDD